MHIIAVAVVTGLSLGVTIMLVGKPASSGSEWDKAVVTLFSTGISNSYYLVFITSCLFSMFTNWGFLKHWWIIIKWCLIWIMFALAWYWGGPVISGMVSMAEGGLADPSRAELYFKLLNQSKNFILLLDVLLLIMFVLSVYKPFGATGFKSCKKGRIASCIVGSLIILATVIGFASEHMHAGYRALPVPAVSFNNLPDGTYYGEEDYGSFTYRVEVFLQKGRIVKIQSIDPRDSKYAYYAEGVFSKIIREQKVDVDAITGATTTSRAYQNAVGDALSNN